MPRLSNDRYETFARVYVATKNKSEGCRQAGYYETYSDELMANPEIAARISELTNKGLTNADITAERVMLELGRLAFADVRNVYDKRGNLLPVHEFDDDAAATIAGIEAERKTVKKERVARVDMVSGEPEIDDTGAPIYDEVLVETVVHKVKRYDKTAPLTVLAKHFKIVGDEGEGLNAVASALADRLKTARKRQKGASDEGQ